MFTGSITQETRQILLEAAQGWQVEDVYVGCAGNFTVERVLAPLAKFHFHANDVSVYSCALGGYLAGTPIPVTLSAQGAALYPWMPSYFGSPVDQVASLILLTSFAAFLQRSGEVKPNRYYRRMATAFGAQWAKLHAQQVDGLNRAPLHLDSFAAEDVVTWVQKVPATAGLVMYPPFYRGGYESLYAAIEALVDWDAPKYVMMDGDGVDRLAEAVADRPFWMVGLDHELSSLSAYHRGILQSTPRQRAVHVYASSPVTRVVAPHQRMKPILIERLSSGERLGENLSMYHLKPEEFAELRAFYLNARIMPASSDGYAVVVDGKIVGAFAFQFSIQHDTGDAVYMLSDFAVAPTSYRRLSKLVLMAALSTEAKRIAERMGRRRIRYVITSAFSNKPVSMKYRGLFALTGRRVLDEDEQKLNGHSFLLSYRALAGQWALQDVLALWRERFEKDS